MLTGALHELPSKVTALSPTATQKDADGHDTECKPAQPNRRRDDGPFMLRGTRTRKSPTIVADRDVAVNLLTGR